jgi:hypothetical protein
MPKQKENLITINACLKRISPGNIKMTRISPIRFNVYFLGAYLGTIQKVGQSWAHFTATSDRRLPTQEEAAESLIRWALNNSPSFYLNRIKFVNGDFFRQENHDTWEPAGQKAPDCFAGITIS